MGRRGGGGGGGEWVFWEGKGFVVAEFWVRETCFGDIHVNIATSISRDGISSCDTM